MKLLASLCLVAAAFAQSVTTEEPVNGVVDEEPTFDDDARANLHDLQLMIGELIRDEVSTSDLASDISAAYVAMYSEQVASLQEVCEGEYREGEHIEIMNGVDTTVVNSTGEVCRTHYQQEMKMAVIQTWQDTFIEIQRSLNNLYTVSASLMATAYADAAACEKIGCPCQVAGANLGIEYEGVLTLQQQIVDWEVTISGYWAQIIANEQECPGLFEHLYDEYLAEWASWDTSANTARPQTVEEPEPEVEDPMAGYFDDYYDYYEDDENYYSGSDDFNYYY